MICSLFHYVRLEICKRLFCIASRKLYRLLGAFTAGGIKYLDIGMVEIDLTKIRNSEMDYRNTSARITSSDKFKALTGTDYLGEMKLTIVGTEALQFD